MSTPFTTGPGNSTTIGPASGDTIVTSIGTNVTINGTPVTGTYVNVGTGTQNNGTNPSDMGNASGNNIVAPTAVTDPNAYPDVDSLMAGKNLWLNWSPNAAGAGVALNQTDGRALPDSAPVYLSSKSTRMQITNSVSIVVSYYGGWNEAADAGQSVYLWVPMNVQDVAVLKTTVPPVLAGYEYYYANEYTRKAIDSIIKAKSSTGNGVTQPHSYDIGMTRKDADVLWLLNTNQISRKQVAQWSPLLDTILFDPYNPTRDASVAGTGVVAASSPAASDPGNKYKGEPNAPTMADALKIPITAAMLVGLTKLASALGGDAKIIASPIIPALNSGNYAQAIGLVNTLKGPDGKPIANKEALITQLSKDGVPSADGSVTETLYNDNARPYINPTTTPGFSDPNGKYPAIVEEASTSRLARNQSISRTIISRKSAGRVTDVRTANGVEWSQPIQPYNAQYPFNHVRQTESGHVQEFDDTPGNERIHTYHRSGTYEEVDKNGTRVNRIVGDDFEILERNGHVLIKGTCNVTIMGHQNIRVEQDANIEVKGDVRMKVAGNVRQGVNGGVFQDVLGDVLSKVGGNIVANVAGNMQAKVGGSSVVNVSGGIDMSAGGSMNINCGGNFNVQASKINLNPGSVSTGSAATVPEQTKFPVGTKKADEPQFSELITAPRDQEGLASYEQPSDGDSTAYLAAVKKAGADPATKADASKKATGPIQPATGGTASPPPVVPVPSADISTITTFDSSFPLSPNFKLGDFIQFPCGKPGTQDPALIENMRYLAVNCLEPIKKRYPNMSLTSAFRARHPVTGAVPDPGDHGQGCAVDMQFNGFTRQQMVDTAAELSKMLPAYTQLLLEYRNSSCWIHISFNRKKGATGDAFTMNMDKRITSYPKGGYQLVG